MKISNLATLPIAAIAFLFVSASNLVADTFGTKKPNPNNPAEVQKYEQQKRANRGGGDGGLPFQYKDSWANELRPNGPEMVSEKGSGFSLGIGGDSDGGGDGGE